MLDTIKQYINTSPDVPFSEYYQGYICKVQDYTLDQELKMLGKSDALSIDKLIAKLMKEMEDA
jgi:hypothetical protein